MTYEQELQRTAERMRTLSEPRLRAQQGRFRALLAAMTERRVPELAPRAWGDQLLVIGRDLGEERGAQVVPALVALRRSFDLLP